MNRGDAEQGEGRMTALAPGLTVRVSSTAHPIFAGRTGVVSKQLVASRRWKVTFADKLLSGGRTGFGVFEQQELEVISDGK